MARRIPDSAFEVYVALGPTRSYQALADELKVSKRAITMRAKKENWQARLDALEAKAKADLDKRLVESIEGMNDRHVKSARVIQARALEALKQYPIESAMEAVRALEIGIRQERLIRGEPSERTSLQVEEVVKRQYERWMTPSPSDGGASGGES